MYEINSFFWYKALFTAELLFAESMMSFRLPKRSLFPLRAVAAIVACVGVSFALPVLSGAAWTSLLFIAMFAASFGGLAFCFRADAVKILFCGIAGYTVQHISAQLFDLSVLLMGQAVESGSDLPNIGSNPLAWFPTFAYGSGTTGFTGNPFILTWYFFTYGLTCFVAYLLTARRLRGNADLQMKSISMLMLVVVILLTDVVLGAMVNEYARGNFDKFYVAMLDVTNVLCCALAMFIQFNVALVRKLERDLDAVNVLWEQDKAQYELTRENINLINVKCHDLKHQIRRLGGEKMDEDTIAEIEDMITIYDSKVKTGNEALDVILTEKSLFCHANAITLSCIADGKQLDFMKSADIYSLFGNIVDNAVEAVSKLPQDKRVISLTVKEAKGVVFVNIYNYYDGTLTFENALPVTTKSDKSRHGYGMKSVKLLAEKYGGELRITPNDHVFSLSIVFARADYRA